MVRHVPRIRGLLISYCGVVCEFCPAYRGGKCPGCDPHADACEYIKCAREKELTSYFLCGEFPCRLHEEGFAWKTEELGELRWKVYSSVFTSMKKTI